MTRHSSGASLAKFRKGCTSIARDQSWRPELESESEKLGNGVHNTAVRTLTPTLTRLLYMSEKTEVEFVSVCHTWNRSKMNCGGNLIRVSTLRTKTLRPKQDVNQLYASRFCTKFGTQQKPYKIRILSAICQN